MNISFDESDFRIIVRPDNISRIDKVDSFSDVFHEEIEIKYFVEGSSTLQVGNESVATQVGDIVVINPYEFHSTVNYAEKKGKYHLLMIGLDFFDSDLLDLRYLFTKEKIRITSLIRGNERLKRIISDIVDEIKGKREYYKKTVTALVLELFTLLLRDYRDEAPATLPSDRSMRYYEVIYPAITLIRRDCGAEHSVDTLAEVCGVSKCHFCRIFKQSTTMTPIEYRNDYRLQMAKLLLFSTSKSISEISLQCGFDDPAYFSRCYKKKFGHSPNKDRAI